MTKNINSLIFSLLFLTACGGGGGGGGDNGGGNPPPPNVAPTVDAGPDQSVNEGIDVNLSGTANDSDGSISSYQWMQLSGPGVFIAHADAATASFTAPFVTSTQTVTLQLTVTDNSGASANDSVTIEINDQPSGLPSNQVQTQQGTLEGTLDGGLRIFRGVRYASPPTGNLRFKPPQEPQFVAGVTPVDTQRSPCIQAFNGNVFGEEDCLFLNIWAPDDEQSHPVIVFLHGGTQLSPVLDGANLARESNSVVVTLHRREFVMAYLAIQELADESPTQAAGNYAVLDVIQALRWVQSNIAEFGGDPQLVMLAGESAGGRLVCHVFAAPDAAGLFQSAAVQSGPCQQRYRMTSEINEESPFEPLRNLQASFLSVTGCNSLQCLRDLPAADVVNAAVTSNAVFAPAMDGIVVLSNPFDALRNLTAGQFTLIAGSTKDESRNLISTPIPDDAAYRNFLAGQFPANVADQLYNLYPTMDYASAKDAFHTLYSDLIGCVAEPLAEAASTNRQAYLYTLNRGSDLSDIAGHANDVIYLFNSFSTIGVVPDQQAADITSAMQSGWLGIAAAPHLEPLLEGGNSGNLVWPAWAADNTQVLELGDPVIISSQYRGGRCGALLDVFTSG